jgi:hypothetical protein
MTFECGLREKEKISTENLQPSSKQKEVLTYLECSESWAPVRGGGRRMSPSPFIILDIKITKTGNILNIDT